MFDFYFKFGRQLNKMRNYHPRVNFSIHIARVKTAIYSMESNELVGYIKELQIFLLLFYFSAVSVFYLLNSCFYYYFTSLLLKH